MVGADPPVINTLLAALRRKFSTAHKRENERENERENKPGGSPISRRTPCLYYGATRDGSPK